MKKLLTGQLSRYSVEWQTDNRHVLRVGNPRLYDYPYQSPQLPLWEPGDVEWFVSIRTDPPMRRHKPRGKGILGLFRLCQFEREAENSFWA